MKIISKFLIYTLIAFLAIWFLPVCFFTVCTWIGIFVIGKFLIKNCFKYSFRAAEKSKSTTTTNMFSDLDQMMNEFQSEYDKLMQEGR